MKNLANFKTDIKTREYLIQAIYQMFFNKQDPLEIIEQFKKEHEFQKVNFDKFSESLLSINKYSEEFKKILKFLDIQDKNINLLDKSIIYFAINEIKFGNLDTPVVIDESLRLSKKFSNPESYKFINACLDKYIKNPKSNIDF
jgi:Transcription termination factor|tara:strand:+ start:999 stop:1427 length:429 start_codon:yes stop_codon:yes gene_type:complete